MEPAVLLIVILLALVSCRSLCPPAILETPTRNDMNRSWPYGRSLSIGRDGASRCRRSTAGILESHRRKSFESSLGCRRQRRIAPATDFFFHRRRLIIEIPSRPAALGQVCAARYALHAMWHI